MHGGRGAEPTPSLLAAPAGMGRKTILTSAGPERVPFLAYSCLGSVRRGEGGTTSTCRGPSLHNPSLKENESRLAYAGVNPAHVTFGGRTDRASGWLCPPYVRRADIEVASVSTV